MFHERKLPIPRGGGGNLRIQYCVCHAFVTFSTVSNFSSHSSVRKA